MSTIEDQLKRIGQSKKKRDEERARSIIDNIHWKFARHHLCPQDPLESKLESETLPIPYHPKPPVQQRGKVRYPRHIARTLEVPTTANFATPRPTPVHGQVKIGTANSKLLQTLNRFRNQHHHDVLNKVPDNDNSVQVVQVTHTKSTTVISQCEEVYSPQFHKTSVEFPSCQPLPITRHQASNQPNSAACIIQSASHPLLRLPGESHRNFPSTILDQVAVNDVLLRTWMDAGGSRSNDAFTKVYDGIHNCSHWVPCTIVEFKSHDRVFSVDVRGRVKVVTRRNLRFGNETTSSHDKLTQEMDTKTKQLVTEVALRLITLDLPPDLRKRIGISKHVLSSILSRCFVTPYLTLPSTSPQQQSFKWHSLLSEIQESYIETQCRTQDAPTSVQVIHHATQRTDVEPVQRLLRKYPILPPQHHHHKHEYGCVAIDTLLDVQAKACEFETTHIGRFSTSAITIIARVEHICLQIIPLGSTLLYIPERGIVLPFEILKSLQEQHFVRKSHDLLVVLGLEILHAVLDGVNLSQGLLSFTKSGTCDGSSAAANPYQRLRRLVQLINFRLAFHINRLYSQTLQSMKAALCSKDDNSFGFSIVVVLKWFQTCSNIDETSVLNGAHHSLAISANGSMTQRYLNWFLERTKELLTSVPTMNAQVFNSMAFEDEKVRLCNIEHIESTCNVIQEMVMLYVARHLEPIECHLQSFKTCSRMLDIYFDWSKYFTPDESCDVSTEDRQRVISEFLTACSGVGDSTDPSQSKIVWSQLSELPEHINIVMQLKDEVPLLWEQYSLLLYRSGSRVRVDSNEFSDQLTNCLSNLVSWMMQVMLVVTEASAIKIIDDFKDISDSLNSSLVTVNEIVRSYEIVNQLPSRCKQLATQVQELLEQHTYIDKLACDVPYSKFLLKWQAYATPRKANKELHEFAKLLCITRSNRIQSLCRKVSANEDDATQLVMEARYSTLVKGELHRPEKSLSKVKTYLSILSQCIETGTNLREQLVWLGGTNFTNELVECLKMEQAAAPQLEITPEWMSIASARISRCKEVWDCVILVRKLQRQCKGAQYQTLRASLKSMLNKLLQQHRTEYGGVWRISKTGQLLPSALETNDLAVLAEHFMIRFIDCNLN